MNADRYRFQGRAERENPGKIGIKLTRVVRVFFGAAGPGKLAVGGRPLAAGGRAAGKGPRVAGGYSRVRKVKIETSSAADGLSLRRHS